MGKLTRQLKERAHQLGFDLVGVTHPQASEHADIYTNWLAQGYHAEMGYLARPDAVKKRADARHVMPETRSILVVGMNYYPGDHASPGESEGFRGRVSRYAWGDDYHEVMWEKLGRLAEWIKQCVGRSVAHRAYVDTGPLLERELAQRAGLGWVGKNTNLISPTLGSYFFLGELLLDLELEPDQPFDADRCGTCTACLDACPTGALVAPRTLDARRCISYLTIEHRSVIPEELCPLLSDWTFGCDVCQQVCPWNHRFAHPTDEPAFRGGRGTLNLLALLALDEETFRARFRHTPLWRAKRTGLLRNAAMVLGNLGDPAAVPALQRALADDTLIAEHAAWALERLTAPSSA